MQKTDTNILREDPSLSEAAHKADTVAKLTKLLSACLPRLTSRLTDSNVDIDSEAHFIVQIREVLDQIEGERKMKDMYLVQIYEKKEDEE